MEFQPPTSSLARRFTKPNRLPAMTDRPGLALASPPPSYKGYYPAFPKNHPTFPLTTCLCHGLRGQLLCVRCLSPVWSHFMPKSKMLQEPQAGLKTCTTSLNTLMQREAKCTSRHEAGFRCRATYGADVCPMYEGSGIVTHLSWRDRVRKRAQRTAETGPCHPPNAVHFGYHN
jgi:hypothetical protein